MPLYLVKENDKPDRLVDAKSESAAIKHAFGTRFSATIITNPILAAELVGTLGKVEKEGEAPPPVAKDDKGAGTGDGGKTGDAGDGKEGDA